jgi:O-antigen/teichoic acid export membrane protein
VFDSKRYLRNISFNQAAFAVSIALGFFISPFIVRTLGDSGNGYWSLVVTLTAYFGYFDLGIHSGIGHYITRHLASGDERALNRTFNSALSVLMAIGALAVLGSLVLSAMLPGFFHVSPENTPAVRMALLTMGLVTAVKFPLSAFHGVLAGAQRYDLMSGASFVAKVVNAGLVWLALTSHKGLPGLAAAVGLVQLLEATACLIMAMRVVPELRPRLFQFSKWEFGQLFQYGAFNFLINIFAQFGAGFGAFIVGRKLSAEAITYYTLGGEFTPYMAGLAGALSMPLLQIVIPMDVKGDLGSLRNLYLTGSKYLFALVCLMGLNLLLVGEPFLGRWMGQKYLLAEPYGSSGTILILSTCAAMCSLSTTVSQQILFGRRQNRIFAVIILAETILIAGLSTLAIQAWGIVGVAAAVLAATFLAEGIWLNAIAGKQAGSHFGAFLKIAILPNLGIGAITYLAGRIFLPFLPRDRYPWLFLSFALVSIFHALCVILFLVERQHLRALAAQLPGKWASLVNPTAKTE